MLQPFRRLAGLAHGTLAAVLLTAPLGAQTQYFGQGAPHITTASSAFMAALTGAGTAGFETLSSGTTNPTLTFPGAGTATLSGGGLVRVTPNSGADAYSGTNYYHVTSSAVDFTITFSNPVAAFGFFGSDLGDASAQLSLIFTRSAGSPTEILVPHLLPGENGNQLFFGFIDVDNPFDSVRFKTTGDSDPFGIDDITIGSPQQVIMPPSSTVPEPMSVVLLGSGLATLGLFHRRRAVR